MRGDLDGKLALVTGGAHGVGKAVATELTTRGAHVLINYFHSHDAAKQTAAELRAAGARVDLFRASVARQDQIEKMFDQIEQRFGGLDILVNGAANGALVPGAAVTEAQIDNAIETNYKGGLRCSRLAAPLMARRGGGSIIMLSTLGGSQLVMANYLACAPAKAAAETVARYLAVEFAPLNIRVNTATTCVLASEVADKFPDAADMQRVVREATPLGRLGRPEDFAALIGFLASDAARWITGQEIVADGGLSLGAAMLSPAPRTEPEEAAAYPEDHIDGDTDSNRPNVTSAADDQATDAGDEIADEIAVVGMGLTVAGANDPEEFWRVRLDGAHLCVPVPGDRWRHDNFRSADPAAEDKSYQDKSVFITDFDSAAAPMAGPSDHDLTTIWLRHALVQALDGVTTGDQDRCAFLVGYTPDGSQHLEEAGVRAAAEDRCARILEDLDLSAEERATLLDEINGTLTERYRRGAPDPSRFLPHRVGRLAMDGVLPDDTELKMVDTACSSSLYAIDIGIKGLYMGKHDIAVCGGAFALGPRGMVLFSKLNGLSKRGELRSLDADADGVLFADGAAVVVLKRLSRARADGDRVLGVLKAFGSSSDGKGTAIYAPNPDGQGLAVRRALDTPGVQGADVDWIIAHATGTPAGDFAEFSTLRRHFGIDRPTYITSNKSLFGHTGWAAGVVSLIEALLGLAHETIPPQHNFNRTPDDFRIDETQLNVPVGQHNWPARPGRARTVAISGFGFGGTNAHLLVREDRPNQAMPARSRLTGRTAIVGVTGHVPGLSTPDDFRQWLLGGVAPQDSFGEFYPVPPFSEVRMPPPTARTIDRCQLMILRCATDLRDRLAGLWEHGTRRAGVFVGHLGPTRAAMLFANRCYLDDIEQALRANPRLSESPVLAELTAALRTRVRSQAPPSNEDAFPGIMPNVISARVANYFDLNGPNITLDSGLSSTLSALEAAHRYLLAGEVEFALVSGINGNTLPEFQALLTDILPEPGTGLAEGAFMFALTTPENADLFELPVLAHLDAGAGEPERSINCGASSPEHARYLGAAGGLALAQALHGPAGRVDLVCDEADRPAARLALTVTGQADPVPAGLPQRFHSDQEYRPGKPIEVSRYVSRLRPSEPIAVRESVPFLPDATVLLTDQPDLLDGVVIPAGTTVISTGQALVDRPGWHQLAEVTADTVAECLATAGTPVRHVRMLTDLGGVAPDETDPSTRLQDAVFLTLQDRYDEIRSGGGSLVVTVLGASRDGRPHPCHGLFSALVKCTYHEFPDCLVFGVFTEDQDVTAAIRLTELESTAERTYPVVFHDGRRKIPVLHHEPVHLADPAMPTLNRESVVLATGGARGITAEVVKELARVFGCRIHLLGSNPLTDYPDEVFAGTDEQFAAGRPDFIRRERAARNGVAVAELNREFDRMADARAARRNIAEMERHSGRGRVTYVPCDVTDADAVTAAVSAVLATSGRIDLLVNAAGRNRGAIIREKNFVEFQAIRDLKVRGYRNLKRALRDQPPRLWCNFGSLLGYFGLPGELDYGSGNDFLDSAARWAAGQPETDEFTVGWTLWDSVGIGANELAKSYFRRGGSYTHMAVEEGLHHFVRELHAANRQPFVVHLGAAERGTVDRLYPGYSASNMDGNGSPYPMLTLARSDHEASFECPIDLAIDGNLDHHVVRDVPTLPGTWVTEIATQAARSLAGDLEVIGFADLAFDRFVPALPGGPKRVTAQVVARTGELTTVRVRITTDIVSPQGTVLTRDRPLSSATVLLAPEFPAAPNWRDWPADSEIPVLDPYHRDTSPVRLTGPFVATTRTRRHIYGKRARFRPDDLLANSTLARFTIPVVLLDAMVRTEALAPVEDDLLPVAVPLSIRRIDLYQRANDQELIGQHSSLELYATPAASTVDVPDPHNRFVAATQGGQVVAQIKDVQAIAIGHVHAGSGQVRSIDSRPISVRHQ